MAPSAPTSSGAARSTARYGILSLPWIVALVLTAIAPAYLGPLVSTIGGFVALAVAIAVTLGGWFAFPWVVSIGRGATAYLVRGLWGVIVTVPGIFIVVMGPPIIVVLRTVRG
jgi:hypothetical protein